MSQPYIGEIRMFGGNFPPERWEFCNGQLLSISNNQALFALIGTIYGGDGQTTFALPNLQSRFPIHAGSNAGTTFPLGQTGGLETVIVTATQLPTHTHSIGASTGPQTSNRPTGAYQSTGNSYSTTHDTTAAATEPAGGGQAHENLPPYLVVNYIICVFGIFPTRS
jgi:microcystin-dependent protein